MTKEQRDLYFANRKAEAASEESSKLRRQQEQQSQLISLEKEIDGLCAANGLDKNRFFKLYGALAEKQVGDGKRFQAPEDIEPQHVIEFHQDIQHIGKVIDAVSEVNEALADDSDFCNEIFEITRNRPDFSVEDISTIVRDALNANSPAIENLNRKVQQANSQTLRTQLNQGSSKKNSQSDIDRELEEDFLKLEKRQKQVAHLFRR
jgi:hypothetical protein